MNKVKYATREEWIEARRHGIGASDSPAILGIGYATRGPASVYSDKINGGASDSDDMRLRVGQAMEPGLRSVLAAVTGLEIAAPEPFTIHRHSEHDWMTATLDGETVTEDGERAVVELKNVSNFSSSEWADGAAPLAYEVQVQHQMAVTNTTKGVLFALVGGNEPVVRRIERNDKFIAALIVRLAGFWQGVLDKEMPEIDGTVATSEALSAIHPNDNGQAVALSAEFAAMSEELKAAKESRKACSETIRALENKIKAAIGNNSYGVAGANVWSWLSSERKAYTVDARTVRTLRLRSSLPRGVSLAE